ncbi:peptide ABC transporter ATP-binding protein [Streptomyces purpurogeneiscleroticus]|nr:peptide ABC transporter ATP-binding protein [Streptomyces purpurogeneiscleroticus]
MNAHSPALATQAEILRVEDLKVHFPLPGRGGSVVHAVDGVSFSVRRGTSFGIVGESGSGKSTTAQGVMRLVSATSGRVVLNGQDILTLGGGRLREARRHIQMVFQDPFASLDPRRSAGDLVAEPLRLLEGLSRREAALRLDELYASVGLPSEARSLFPHQFSGGQRQRICIARALATKPDIIVCDEAVSALDVAIQAQILNLLAQLQAERGLAYVFISHDLGVVQHLCDEVAVMYLGRIVEQASTKAFFSAPRHPYSWSLISAAVPAGPARDALKSRYLVRGEPPSPIDPPAGCRFAGRCPFAVDRCRAEDPALLPVGQGHAVACHRVGEIAPPDFDGAQAA